MKIIIKNGTLIDGSGTPGRRADVLIDGDRISEILEKPLEILSPSSFPSNDTGSSTYTNTNTDTIPDTIVINAEGKIVCPGFIDMHAHSDFSIPTDGAMPEKLRQGITTAVIGSCGFSAAPMDSRVKFFFKTFTKGMFDLRCSFEWETMGEYLDCIKRQGHAANVFAQVGFGNLRLMASGILPFRSGAGAMKKMKRHLEQALEEGARGFSTGLFYPPQNFAPKEEVIEICKVLSKRNSLYSTHIRNEADLLEESVKEALETAERAGVSLQISHHKAVLRRNWGKVFKTMEMIEAAAKEGLDVETDVYPYSSFSNIVLPLIFFNEPDVEKNIVFLDLNHYKELEGKTLEEAMKARGRGARALVLEMALKEGLTGMPVAGFLISEKDLEFLISHPLVSIGSDGNEAPPGRKTHPRLYGSFSRFLEKYCITDKLLSLEEGVRKITSMPARKLGLDKRGLIKEGWYADIVVFDPVSLRDLADYENPLRHPEGFEAVIVNGALTVQKDVQTSARAGRVV